MPDLKRFGVSLDARLLKRFDTYISQKGYKNRSEAIRDLMRRSFVDREWKVGTDEAVGTITLVYDRSIRELEQELTDFQHASYRNILSSLHIHLDQSHCLEVVVIKGKSRDIQAIADRLLGIKGVKHGGLTMTTTGRGLT
jgi:CopG family nickel-responsive transcriptional regulator